MFGNRLAIALVACVPLFLRAQQTAVELDKPAEIKIEYRYCGQPIRKAQFDAMYEYFKLRFGTRVSDGKLFDCRLGKSNLVAIVDPNTGNGKTGLIVGRTVEVCEEGFVLVARDSEGMSYSAYLHLGIQPRDVAIGSSWTLLAVRNGDYRLTEDLSYPAFEPLLLPSEDVLWKWLNAGNKLYHLVKRERRDARPCRRCGGTGQIVLQEGDDSLRRFLDRCPECGGTGRKTDAETDWKWTPTWRPDDEHR